MKTAIIYLVLFCTSVTAAVSQQRTDTLVHRLKQPSGNYIMFGAHRGDWRNAPENSLQAIQRCIDMGLDLVETDVRQTSDGHLILMHDKTLDRTTTGTGKVSAHTLAEIRSLYLKNPLGIVTRQRVPTLEEALTLTNGKILVFLDKAENCIPALTAVLDSMHLQNQVILFGREQMDDEQARSLFGDLLHTTIFVPVIKKSMTDIPGYIRRLSRGIHPVAYALEFDEADTAMIKYVADIKAAGAKVWISTLWGSMCGGHDDELSVADPRAGWGWILDRHTDIVLTDRPADMKQYLESKKLHKQ